MSGGDGLPKGWVDATLEDVAAIHDHLREPVNAEERAKRVGPYPYYGATGQVGWIDGYRQDGEYVLLGEDGAPFLDPTKPKAYMVSGKCWVNNHAHVLNGIGGLCRNKFLLHTLNNANYRGYANGTTRLKLTQRAMRRLPIRLAPPPEQERITAKLEELLSDLDAGVAALQRVKANLKRYRAAVLKAAVEGKLTEEWRRKNPPKEPASVLLDRILKERRKRWEEQQHAAYEAKGKEPPKNWQSTYQPADPVIQDGPELPKGWEIASLEQLTNPVRVICYGILMPKDHIPDGVPYVKVKDMRGDKIDVASLQRTSPEIAAKYARASLVPGDLLLAIRGTYGRVAIVPPELDGGNITQDTARLAVTELVDASFVAWCLRATTTQNYFKRVARGVAVRGVNIGDVKPCPVFLPPLEEQRVIVEEVESRLSVVDVIEEQMGRESRRSLRLRQSILKRAFEGKLVPQDPNDEPASKLLERIRQAKLGSDSKGKRKPSRGRRRKSSNSEKQRTLF